MNIAEKWSFEDQLRNNLREWMISHGTVVNRRSRSNAFTEITIWHINWQGSDWKIVEVDGLTCRIEHLEGSL